MLLSSCGYSTYNRTVLVFYVHANNGFYLDIPFRRLTGWIYGQPAAVS